MTDEEKKAIETIKSFNQYNWEMNNLKEKEFAKPYFDALDTILNLIEKQSKKIEELEKNRKVSQNFAKIVERDYISKDKIKAKIEVMNTNIVNAKKFDCDYIGQCRFAKYVLQSLLEKE